LKFEKRSQFSVGADESLVMPRQKLRNEIDARVGLTVQLSESHVVVRVGGFAVLNDYSETRAFFELRVRYFGDVGAGPKCSIRGLCVVIVPPVCGWVGSGLGFSWIKVYPTENVPDIAAPGHHIGQRLAAALG